MIGRLLLLTALFFFPLVACGDSTSPERTVEGEWTSTSETIDLTLTLSESENGEISGHGQLASVTLTSQVIVFLGLHEHPEVSFTMASSALEDMQFSGTLSGNEMTGTLNGAGFSNLDMTLTREGGD